MFWLCVLICWAFLKSMTRFFVQQTRTIFFIIFALVGVVQTIVFRIMRAITFQTRLGLFSVESVCHHFEYLWAPHFTHTFVRFNRNIPEYYAINYQIVIMNTLLIKYSIQSSRRAWFGHSPCILFNCVVRFFAFVTNACVSLYVRDGFFPQFISSQIAYTSSLLIQSFWARNNYWYVFACTVFRCLHVLYASQSRRCEFLYIRRVNIILSACMGCEWANIVS